MLRSRLLRLAPLLTLGLLFTVLAAYALLERTPLSIGGQAEYVHNITLYDAEGEILDPKNSHQPVSLAVTCGKCHDVDRIHQGTHFAGGWAEYKSRPLEPWLTTEPALASAYPTPPDLDYATWMSEHGAHSPGSVVPDAKLLDARARFGGTVEVDCFVCHLRPGQYDFFERSRQIKRGNFRWAITAAARLGVVTGEVNKLARTYSAETDEFGETPGVPAIAWEASRFAADKRVHLDLSRSVPDTNCLLCHSTDAVGQSPLPVPLSHARDIHTLRGMSCTDCHQNTDGVGHSQIRGDVASSGALSCIGCHLGTPEQPGGLYGAPIPEHLGIPPLHFAQLSCAACHSGPAPGKFTPLVQTSRAHLLGLPSDHRSAAAWPHIVGNVFLRDADGLIAPFRATWPSGFFRADAAANEDQPVSTQELRATLRTLGIAERTLTDTFTGPELARILSALPAAASQVFFEQAGRRKSLGPDGTLTDIPSPRAPFTWAQGHPVRPARESLGARGCIDCHTPDGPMDFALTAAFATATTSLPTVPQVTQLTLRGEPSLPPTLLNATFIVRPHFKWALFGLLLVGLLRLLIRARPVPSFRLGRMLLILLGLAAIGALATSLPALLGFTALTGYWLLLHFAFGTAACAFLVLLAWTRASSLLARLTLVGTLVTLGSVLLSMTPLLSTPAIILSLQIHRIASLLTLALATVWLYTLLRPSSPSPSLP